MNKKLLLVIFLFALIVFVFSSFNVDAQNSDTNDDFRTITNETNSSYVIAFPFFSLGKQIAEPIGPIGGTFTSVLTDPNSSNIVIGGHFQSGVYVSFDEGTTWYARNNGLTNLHIQSLAIHPRHGEIIYAGTYGGGVFLSTDRGLNWQPSSGGTLTNHIIYDIEIDPKNPSIVYAASRISGSLVGYVSRSTDAGRTWTIVYRGDYFSTPDYFYDIEVNPANINMVYFTAHEHGFYRSVDNGLTFSAINAGVDDLSARGLAMNEANQNVIIGGVWHGGGVYKSANIGDSWQSSRTGLPADVKITKIKGDPNNAYGNRFFATTYANGLYVSVNSGASWKNHGWNGSHINDIAISSYYPQTWYLATQNSGMVRTRDGGENWATIMGDLRLYTITGMQALEDEPENIYVAIHGLGVHRVESPLDTWTTLYDGLNDLNITGLFSDGKSLWLNNGDGLWVYENDLWQSIDLPKPKDLTITQKLRWENKVLGESDATSLEIMGGENDIQKGLETSNRLTVTRMLTFQENLIIGTTDGIWLRSDSGWKTLGLEGLLIYDMVADDKNSTMWVSACDCEMNCEVYRFLEANLIKQSNGLDNTRVNQFLISGDNLFSATETGVFSWQEKNTSWELTVAVSEGVYSIAHNRENPKLLAAGSKGFVLISHDSGQSWKKIKTEYDWHYPFLLFNYAVDVKLMLGSIESGAFIMKIDE